MLKKIAFASLVLSLSACSSGESFGRPGSPVWLRTTPPAEQAKYFGGVCESYGFQAGTPEMASCIQRETIAAKERGAGNGNTVCNMVGSTMICT